MVKCSSFTPDSHCKFQKSEQIASSISAREPAAYFIKQLTTLTHGPHHGSWTIQLLSKLVVDVLNIEVAIQNVIYFVQMTKIKNGAGVHW